MVSHQPTIYPPTYTSISAFCVLFPLPSSERCSFWCESQRRIGTHDELDVMMKSSFLPWRFYWIIYTAACCCRLSSCLSFVFVFLLSLHGHGKKGAFPHFVSGNTVQSSSRFMTAVDCVGLHFFVEEFGGSCDKRRMFRVSLYLSFHSWKHYFVGGIDGSATFNLCCLWTYHFAALEWGALVSWCQLLMLFWL